MTPVTDERTAPEAVAGAVPFREERTEPGDTAPPLTERAFWRAVVATIVPVTGRRRR